MKAARAGLRILALLFLVGSLAAASATASGDEVLGDFILGLYALPDGDGELEVYRRGALYFGRVMSLPAEPDLLDENNPDPAQRLRRFVGTDMLAGFRFDPQKGRFVDGNIYDPRSGDTYRAVLWFDDGARSPLRARGYVLFEWLGVSVEFDRLDEARPSTE